MHAPTIRPPSPRIARVAAKWTTWSRSMLVIMLPISTAIVLYRLSTLDSMLQIPVHPNTRKLSSGLVHMEAIGVLELLGPEDLVYDPKKNVIYTGCANGEIKQFTINDDVSKTVIQSLAQTGGRPLGLALGKQGNLLVADANKGLIDVNFNGTIKVLSIGAEGKIFKLVDGLDIANDGIIYFTDASYKYTLNEYILDILERMPYGRLMSYNPKTNVTKVLLHDLYFANGVTLMPNHKALIFCETSMARCSKYYIKGNKKGKVEKFVEDLPGLPDMIHYDKAEDLYWIALSMDVLGSRNASLECATIGKNFATMDRCRERLVPNGKRHGGILVVDSRGETKTFYYDPELSFITSVIRLKNYAYVGSSTYPYILRLDLARYNTTN
ncbi:unnamed protein product [Rhodiola kirilowii]